MLSTSSILPTKLFSLNPLVTLADPTPDQASSYIASKIPLHATDIQNLMIQSLDNRFTGGKMLRHLKCLASEDQFFEISI